MAIRHEVTDELKEKVAVLKSGGLTNEQIAYCLDISRATLEKRYKKELELGKAKVDAMVIGKLLHNIKKGDVASIFFYLKTRCRWTEKAEETTEKDQLEEIKFEIMEKVKNV